jgi:hypothetical protein
VDNFHTGYNLVSIYEYQKYCKDSQFEHALKTGLTYHLRHHYDDDMLPKYTDKELYPLDIHCFAQSIITFLTLREFMENDVQNAHKIVQHVVNMMWDPAGKYFWYQKNKLYTVKIPYIRWAQAWMFYALSRYLNEGVGDGEG